MLILAIDTSGHAGSVALLDGDRLVAEVGLDSGCRSAQTLAPAIVSILAEQSRAPSEVSLVATTIGPGSFTGLRIGVTAAKTFAYATGAGVLGVSTLEALAHQATFDRLVGLESEIHAVLDAQRQEVYLGRFAVEPVANAGEQLPQLTRLEGDHIVAAQAWLSSLSPGTVVTGGIERLLDRLPTAVTVVAPPLRDVQAATVGRLAWRDYQLGRRDDLWKLAPVYLRPSYAEEKASRSTR